MSVLGTIVAGSERRAALKEPPDWLWDAFGAAPTASGKQVRETGALALIPVFACVRLLAGSVAQCPLIVYRGQGKDRQRARDSWQWKLLHERPNDEHAPDVFYETVTGHENLWGNWYAEKVTGRKGGRTVVGELWPVNPAKVKPGRDSRQRKVFEVEGNPRSFTADRIVHVPAFGYDGLRGLSPIAQAREDLGVAVASQEYIARVFSNNAMLGGVIQLPDGKTLSQERADALRAQWRAMHNLKTAGSTAVLEDGATWQSTGMPLKDLEFVALNRFGVNQVARLFQVPPEMIGGDREQSMTYSTVEGQALHFVKFSLARWLIRIEQGLKHDRDLFPEGPGSDLYPEFLVEGLLRGDSKTRAEFYAQLVSIKAMTPNEVRERENMEPLPGGDEVAEIGNVPGVSTA